MSDQGFPIIEYARGQTPRQWGQMHGESYREGIQQLYEIRIALMREKNPSLSVANIDQLALEQWHATKQLDADLTDELQGLSEGAGLTLDHLVVLNNYTDFRDIQLPDEGCSLVFVNQEAGPIVGQTWDMHGTAKKYVCLLQIPLPASDGTMVVFSVVGCIGMMGFTSWGTTVGVNNINTDGAVAGSMWPAVVRKTLQQPSQPEMVSVMTSAHVTSGHSYLIASREQAEMWEIMPELSERVGRLTAQERGVLFHTNHCLGVQAMQRERPTAQNSTTHIRYELLQNKVGGLRTFDDMYDLMNDHENYPKSICSNFQASSQDPSITCGGAVGHLTTGEVTLWRGDPQYDANFIRHTFQLSHRRRGLTIDQESSNLNGHSSGELRGTGGSCRAACLDEDG